MALSRPPLPLKVMRDHWAAPVVPFYRPGSLPTFSAYQLESVKSKAAVTSPSVSKGGRLVSTDALEAVFGPAAYSTTEVEDCVQSRLMDSMPETAPLPFVAFPITSQPSMPAPIVSSTRRSSDRVDMLGSSEYINRSSPLSSEGSYVFLSESPLSSMASFPVVPTWFQPGNGYFQKGLSLGVSSAALRGFYSTAARHRGIESTFHVLCQVTPRATGDTTTKILGPEAKKKQPTAKQSGESDIRSSHPSNSVPWSPLLEGDLFFSGNRFLPKGEIRAATLPLSLVVGDNTTAEAMRAVCSNELRMASLFFTNDDEGGETIKRIPLVSMDGLSVIKGEAKEERTDRPVGLIDMSHWTLKRAHPFLPPEHMIGLQPLQNPMLSGGGPLSGGLKMLARTRAAVARRLREYSRKGSLSFKLLHFNPQTSLALLSVTTSTLDEHQIRAVLANSGLPVVGDFVYREETANAIAKVHEHQTKRPMSDQSQLAFSAQLHMANSTSPLVTVVQPMVQFSSLWRRLMQCIHEACTASDQAYVQPDLCHKVDSILAVLNNTKEGKDKRKSAVGSAALALAPGSVDASAHTDSLNRAHSIIESILKGDHEGEGLASWTITDTNKLRRMWEVLSTAANIGAEGEEGVLRHIASLALGPCVALTRLRYPSHDSHHNAVLLEALDMGEQLLKLGRSGGALGEHKSVDGTEATFLDRLTLTEVNTEVPMSYQLALKQQPVPVNLSGPTSRLPSAPSQLFTNWISNEGTPLDNAKAVLYTLASMVEGGLGSEEYAELLCPRCRLAGHTIRTCPMNVDLNTMAKLPRAQVTERDMQLLLQNKHQSLEATAANGAEVETQYFATKSLQSRSTVFGNSPVDDNQNRDVSSAIASGSPRTMLAFVANQSPSAASNRKDRYQATVPAFHQQGSQKVVCQYCSGWHSVTDCPKLGLKTEVGLSEDLGANGLPKQKVSPTSHKERFDTSVFEDASSDPSLLMCIRCGKHGHYFADCPTLPNGYSDATHCAVCLQRTSVVAHYAHQCSRRVRVPSGEALHSCGVAMKYFRSTVASEEKQRNRPQDREMGSHRSRNTTPPHRTGTLFREVDP